MKNGFWDRVLIVLYVLLTVALVALLGLQVFGIDLITSFYENLEAQAPGLVWKLIVSGIGAIIALLGVFVLVAIMPPKRARRSFIVLTNDENGQVKIALPALREMAAQAVGDAAGLKDMSVDISEAGDAISIQISLDILSGAHVPTLTMNMQRAVRSYIEMNCGVAVKNVSVVISSVLPAPARAPAIVSHDEPAVVHTEPMFAPATAEPIPEAEPEVREIIFEPTILPDDVSEEEPPDADPAEAAEAAEAE